MARGELPLIQPTTYEELINLPFMIMAAASRAIGYCGAFALLLAAIGIYGIVSFAVGQRRHEMTIRQAVGAMPQQVIRLILRDGMFSAACGLVAGLVIMLPITRLLATQLPELSPVRSTGRAGKRCRAYNGCPGGHADSGATRHPAGRDEHSA